MNKLKLLAILASLILLFSCSDSSDHAEVVAVDFPSYDAARAIVGDSVSVKQLLPPGSESHHYEPTPKDMIAISNAKLVIYAGGPSDSWVDQILSSLDHDVRVFKLIDQVDVLEVSEEHEHDHDHHEHEIDEHVWTSPVNEIEIIKALKDELSKIYPEKEWLFEKNADSYISELVKIDQEIRGVVSSSEHKTLIFGSRFPFLYFTEEYGLEHYSAYPGCNESTEPSAKTVASLIEKVKELGLDVVIDVEFGSPLLANAIASESGAKVMKLHSIHTLSRAEMVAGETYLTLMRDNIEVLKEALN